jgi:hypothetical protein
MNFKRCLKVPALVFGLFVLTGMHANRAAAKSLSWKTIMGIKEAGDVVGLGTGAVTGGAPWETLGGSAGVNLSNGNFSFDVKGLVLAVGSIFEFQGNDFPTPPPGFSGVPIGTPGPVTQVEGTLVCNVDGTNGANSVLVDTGAVTLDAQGNAHSSGTFSSSVPAVCSSLGSAGEIDDAFLIRIVSCPTLGNPCPFAGSWIAFGAVLSGQ